MHLPRRIQDALKTLWGRSEPQAEILEIRAQWLEIQAHIANTLAKMNTWAARVAKQEQRAAERVEHAPPPQPTPIQGYGTPAQRKQELRRKLSEMRGLRSPVSLSSPPEEEKSA